VKVEEVIIIGNFIWKGCEGIVEKLRESFGDCMPCGMLKR
jgi:hypothetical protein